MKIIKRIIMTLLSLLAFIIISYNIYNFISIKVLKKDIVSINGYSLLEVVSGSMEPKINVGDVILINEKDKDYKVDDIITFKDINGSFVTHRITDIEDDKYITKGDHNNTKDSDKLTEDQIIGKYVKKVPRLGKIIASFQDPITLVLILVIGIILCIITSTDKNGNVIDLTDDEKEYIEFIEYKNKKKNIKEETETKENENKKEIKTTQVKKTNKKKSNNKKGKKKNNKKK